MDSSGSWQGLVMYPYVHSRASSGSIQGDKSLDYLLKNDFDPRSSLLIETKQKLVVLSPMRTEADLLRL